MTKNTLSLANVELEEALTELARAIVGNGVSVRLKGGDDTVLDLDASWVLPAPPEPDEVTTDVTDDDTLAELDEEADAAADFMEGLLDALDLPGDLKIQVDDRYARIEVTDLGTGALIGRRGQTLESIQELLRASLQRDFQRRARVILDIEAYRERRLEKFLERAEEAIDEVLDTGESVRLEPMDVYERKQVHDLVAEQDGVTSRSHGREPSRRIIIEPDDA